MKQHKSWIFLAVMSESISKISLMRHLYPASL